MIPNLYSLPGSHEEGELITPLVEGAGFRVERIVSWGDVTPEGSWYDQDQDEWVLVLQGEGVVEDSHGTQTVLAAGDSLFLPAHCRHRVVRTSHIPPCIWVAVHGAGMQARH